MFNHEPEGYRCPFCYVVQGKKDRDFPATKQTDIILRESEMTAFISSHWWPNNKGHVIVVPNGHFENIYDLPDEIYTKIALMAKRIAVALKNTYNCDGTSMRQHNERAGGQDVWHYHLHVFPRYENDELYFRDEQKYLSDPGDRVEYAQKLRDYLNKPDD